MIEKVNEKSFDYKVLMEEGLVIVDFSAKWCRPCKMLSPVLEKISNENDSVKVTQIDIDESPILSAMYNVRNIPMLLFFKDGQIVDEIIGFVPQEVINNVIDYNLENDEN